MDLAGILRASLQRWTVSYPSEKEMTNAHKGLRVSLNSLMDFSWLWHPSPVILLGRMWFSSRPRGRCVFPEYFFKKLFMYFILVGLALSAACVFSSFEEQGLPFIGAHWLLIVVASLTAEHRL